MKISVSQGQSIFDVALQWYGSAEGVHDIVLKNDFDYDVELTGGQLIEVSETPISRPVVSFFQEQNIVPNNG